MENYTSFVTWDQLIQLCLLIVSVIDIAMRVVSYFSNKKK